MTMRRPADWLERRIPAVFAVVLITWVLIAAWKVIRS
jgi:hypothetical protein